MRLNLSSVLAPWRTVSTWLSFGGTIVLLMALSWFWVPPAHALTQIQLTDLSTSPCSVEVGRGAVTSGGTTHPARCMVLEGIAKNTSNKTVYDADVYGRIYDANGDTVMQNRTRVGSIAEVPPGDHPFELRLSIPLNQPLPLQLKQFKASGFSSSVKARF